MKRGREKRERKITQAEKNNNNNNNNNHG